MSFPNSFGQVVPPGGPLVGFPGTVSRMGGERTAPSRPVLATTANPLQFGAGAITISNSTNGAYQSLSDFLATPSNAQFLQVQFSGVAIRNVKTQTNFLSLRQSVTQAISTTATQATVGALTLVVASATGLTVGMSVEGIGIQAATIVTSVVGTTIGISLGTLVALSASAVAFTSTTLNNGVVGSFEQGTEADVLERGSVTVVITNGTPSVNLGVYIRTVANGNLPGTFVGGFEAAADQATTTATITTTQNSTTLTTSNGTGIAIGQMMTGAGIQPGTYIVSGAGTAWVMSKVPYAATTAGAASFFNTALLVDGNGNPEMVFRTGQIDTNLVSEITLKNRNTA